MTNYLERLQEVSIFKRFPNFIPFIGEDYEDAPVKMLLIWESYYYAPKTENKTSKCINDIDSWYETESQDDINNYFCKRYKDGVENFNNHWNFASKMHRNGIDTKSPTFSNVGKLLDFNSCAGYNYFLRPALGATTIKDTKYDRAVAFETLNEIIEAIEPDFVIFFSKKSHNSFVKKLGDKRLGNVKIEAFTHPASAWWNNPHGKDKKSGKTRFVEFLAQKNINFPPRKKI